MLLNEEAFELMKKECGHTDVFTYDFYCVNPFGREFLHNGCYVYFMESEVNNKKTIHLSMLYTIESQRNKGTARNIILDMQSQADEINCVVNDANIEMKNLLHSLGFKGSRHADQVGVKMEFENEEFFIWRKE